jgi:hypothetical protein
MDERRTDAWDGGTTNARARVGATIRRNGSKLSPPSSERITRIECCG